MTQTNTLIPSRQLSTQEINTEEGLLLKNGLDQFQLNQTSILLWGLVDGYRSISEIIKILKEAYPEIDGAQERSIVNTFEMLASQELINLEPKPDTSSNAFEKPAEPRLVNYYIPTPEMIWNLELIRQVVLGTLEVYPAQDCDDTIDLSESGLQKAKNLDVVTAGSNKTSQVTPYKNLATAKSFRACSNSVAGEIQKLLGHEDINIVPRGHAYYPAGMSMGWHGNQDAPGLRIYCTWAEFEKQNYFRYENPESGDIITEWEPAGWAVKAFRVPQSPKRLWHCIHASSRRFALGFGVMD